MGVGIGRSLRDVGLEFVAVFQCLVECFLVGHDQRYVLGRNNLLAYDFKLVVAVNDGPVRFDRMFVDNARKLQVRNLDYWNSGRGALGSAYVKSRLFLHPFDVNGVWHSSSQGEKSGRNRSHAQ